ncbi:hypothetical protein Nepgr_010511 [Nepenthes gracilis]|uniref:Uncharacterized protein n=1 Tax=Nepenthes gracilis TaxID=150966 RepID=A0AAD3XLH4_NEPGR|nr:hypothetical protein Nepgr_010511 [Nepenthes gracilis]
MLELDGMCYENSWILPRYHVSAADGGFRANVNVKGTDLECWCEGDICASPREARESAAIQIMFRELSCCFLKFINDSKEAISSASRAGSTIELGG